MREWWQNRGRAVGITRREFLKSSVAGGTAASLDVTLAQNEMGWQLREVNIVPTQIGGYRLLNTLHLGAMCFFPFALLLQFGLRLPSCLVRHSYDIDWLKRLGGYARRFSPVPPAGKFNAGQKLFTLFALVVGPVYGVSGIAIHMPYKLPPNIVRGALNLHFASFIILVCGSLLYFHFFYAPTPWRFALLSSGKPTERFFKMHHSHWYVERKGRVTLEAVRERLYHRPKGREEEIVEMGVAEETSNAEAVEAETVEEREEKVTEAEVVEEKPEEPLNREGLQTLNRHQESRYGTVFLARC